MSFNYFFELTIISINNIKFEVLFFKNQFKQFTVVEHRKKRAIVLVFVADSGRDHSNSENFVG